MAAFSYQNQHPPSLLDLSVFLPDSSINMSGLLQEQCIYSISSYYPYSSPSELLQHIHTHENQTTDSSSIVDPHPQGSSHQIMVTPVSMKRNNKDGSCLSSAESKDSRRARTKKQRDCTGNLKKTGNKKIKNHIAAQSGCVHVRARRGEATDSHSLAERVRREKISERLKLLQSLVPGCDKVSSKALMLDEIINYVQSLQQQVEFLSMKLASVNPILYDLSAMDMNSIVVKPEKPSTSSPVEKQGLITQSSTAVADATTTFSTINNYPLVDNSVTCLLQQEDNVNLLLWSVDEQRQRFFNNHSDFTTLCSFQ